MDEIASTFLKNYQVWHHRRLLLTHIYSKDPKTKSPDLLLKELKFIHKVFEEDSKNYHTWSYRQWVLSFFNRNELWAVEIPFIEKMVNEDVRNNSAWHHRFFVVFDSGVREGDENREDVLRREISFVLLLQSHLPSHRRPHFRYAKGKISLAPNNLSPWNYLRGVLDRTKTPYESIEEFVLPYTKPEESPESIVDLDNPLPSKGAQFPAVPAVEFLADIRESQGRLSEATEVRSPADLPLIDLTTIHSYSNYWEISSTRFGSGELSWMNSKLRSNRLIYPTFRLTKLLGLQDQGAIPKVLTPH